MSDSATAPPTLTALGFCGADDSVHPHQLAVWSRAFPPVEFGVLLRPDREGTPRYASPAWLQELGRTARRVKETSSGGSSSMKLAAHLCGTRVNDVLEGRAEAFLAMLIEIGFQRVQINATAVNGVDTSRLAESVPSLYTTMQRFFRLEFILQKNEETRPLWRGVEELLKSEDKPITNVAMLVDESKGTGVLSSQWPVPKSSLYKTGYAGGLGPSNVATVLPEICKAVKQAPPDRRVFWIDMESSLRSVKDGKDVFDLDKCFSVIEQVCSLGLMERPDYLPTTAAS